MSPRGRRRLRQLAWFAGLWLASLAALGLIVYVLHRLIAVLP
ncbi:MAG TPA: DUF2474 domain-containing protein [Alphaproteobacteria bacterium]|jgi:hypothetical protein|nr:DUF2474 domain-containing protein [Alphaproteobacteria bacterium]